MPQFEDLVSDLLEENLLDDSAVDVKKASNNFNLTKLSQSHKSNLSQYQDFYNDDKSYEIELPDFAYALSKPKTVSPTNADDFHLLNISWDTNENDLVETETRFNTPHNLVKPTRKKLKRKINLNGKYCPKCRLKHPFIQVKCQFCNTRILGNLYYYPLVFISLLLFTVVIGLFVMLKLPK